MDIPSPVKRGGGFFIRVGIYIRITIAVWLFR